MTDARSRLLLVPSLTELEWSIKPLLEEWADVATYDTPGIGDEPPAAGLRIPANAERGLVELDRRGWDRFVLVADEFGVLAALLIAHARPEAVAGLVLGHATISYRREGDRPAINPGVTAALTQLAEVDFRSFVRTDFRSWQGVREATAEAPEADELAERYLERVSHATAIGFYHELIEHEQELESLVRPVLAAVDMPLLLVEHRSCLMFTHEGFEEAVAAFPRAATAATDAKPAVDPAFSGILRDFCARIAREPARPRG